MKNIFPTITYENYINNILIIEKNKLPELKDACRTYKLKIGGNKSELIKRLNEYLYKCKYAIIIQKYIKRWIVSSFFKLKGPALYNKNICVNDTDFVSLEPIKDIDIINFYSMNDNKEFTYGFNISSLIQSFKYNIKKTNPYNRDILNHETIYKIKRCYTLSYILFESFRKENNKIELYKHRLKRRFLLANHNPNIRLTNITHDMVNRYNMIVELRNNNIDRRIQQLFIEIDLLGNYTSYLWFQNLSYIQLRSLYRTINDMWNIRLNLSNNTKFNICPYYSPFDNIFNHRVFPNDINEYDIKVGSLIVFENLIYSGVNDEYRKLGALYALTALTVVSMEARQAYPYLYESVA
tara:strand:- start:14982 stop:16037 length:1056 start_codon:yes stop_codon:yes gene_type:complete